MAQPSPSVPTGPCSRQPPTATCRSGTSTSNGCSASCARRRRPSRRPSGRSTSPPTSRTTRPAPVVGRREMSSTRGVVVVMTALLCVMGACSAPTPGPKVEPAPPRSDATVSSVSPGTTASPAGLGVAVSDLHQLDWDEAPLPSGFCGVPAVTRFSGGFAATTSATWGGVTVAVLQVTYGNLLGDDAEEAALGVYCDNGGGTASSTLEYGIAVYAGRAGELVSLGILTAQKQDADQMATLLSVKEWRDRSLGGGREYDPAPVPAGWSSRVADNTPAGEGDDPSPRGPPRPPR